MKKNTSHLLFINLLFVVSLLFYITFIPAVSFSAENIEAILDTNNGNSQFSVIDSTGTNVVAAIDSLGRLMTVGSVGIGIGTASTALHISSGAGDTTAITTIENTAGSFKVFIRNDTPEGAVTALPGALSVDPLHGGIYIKNTGVGTAGWARLAFVSGGVENVANNILSNLSPGNVAINTSLIPANPSAINIGTAAQPWANLYVNTAYSNTVQSQAGQPLILQADNGTLEMNNTTLDLSAQKVAVTLNPAVNALNFDSGTLVIDANNNRVGIGTSTPTAALQVVNNYVEIGRGAPPAQISQEGDLYVSEDLSVGGTIYGTLEGSINISLVPGSVVFSDNAGGLSADKENFSWDYTNNRLGIGTSAANNKLDIGGNVIIGSTFVTDQKESPTNGLAVEGNVGIGTSMATNALQVVGAAAIGTSDAYQISAPASGLLVEGAVGVGTVNPTTGKKLDVVGDVYIQGALDVVTGVISGNGSGLTNLQFPGGSTFGNVQVGIPISPNTVDTVTGNLTLNADTGIIHMMAPNISLVNTLNIDSDTFVIDAVNDRIGIGVNTPQNTLDVEGKAVIGAGYSGTETAPANGLLVQGAVGIGTTNSTGQLNVLGDVYVGMGTTYHTSLDSDVYVQGNLQVDGSVWLGDASADRLTVTGEFIHEGGDIIAEGGKFGNVRVGITDENTIDTTVGKLTLSSTTEMIDINAVGLDLSSQATTINLIDTANALNIEQNTFVIDAASNHVGIGTPNPTGKLDVMGGNVYIDGGDVYVGVGTDYHHMSGTTGLFVEGNFQVNGSTWLGDDASVDNLTVMGVLTQQGGGTFGNVEIAKDDDNLITTTGGDLTISSFTDTLKLNASTINLSKQATAVNLINATNALNIDSDTLVVDAAANYVGIGTNAPQNKLDVKGAAVIGSNYVSAQRTAQTNGLLVEGAVGIGTFNPTGQLDVMGGNVYIDGGDVYVGVGTSYTNMQGTTGLFVQGNLQVDGSTWLGNEAGVDNLTVTGTLTQNGDVEASGAKFGNIKIAKTDDDTIDTTSSELTIASSALKLNASTINLSKQATAVNLINTANALNIDSDTLVVDAAANFVGIGTNAPQNKLDVKGATVIGSNYVSAQRTAKTDGLLVEGAVGIGTFNPTGQLDVMGGNVYIGVGTVYRFSGSNDLYVQGNLQVDGSTWLGDDAGVDNLTVMGTLIQTGDVQASGATFGNIEIAKSDDNRIDTVSGMLTLASESSTLRIETSLIDLENQETAIRLKGAANALNIDSDTLVVDAAANYVGIGTNAPQNKLDVKGAAVIGSNYVSAQRTAKTDGLLVEGAVGIGTFNPTGQLDVMGGNVYIGVGTVYRFSGSNDLYVQGNLQVDGSTWLGDDAGVDNLTVMGTLIQTGDVQASGATFGNIEIAKTDDNRIDTVSGMLTLASESSTLRIETSLIDLENQETAIKLKGVTNALNIDNDTLVVDAASDFIGIGTNAPQNKLDVKGSTVIGSNYVSDQRTAKTDGLLVEGAVGIGTFNPKGQLDIMGDVYIGVGTSYHINGTTGLFVQGNLQVDGSTWLGDDASVDNLTVLGELIQQGGGTFGNVQIAKDDNNLITTTEGDLTISSFTDTLKLNASTINLSKQATAVSLINAANALRVDGKTFVINAAADRVGIGTASPLATLDVGGGIVDYIDGTKDLLVAGDLEVDGTIYGQLSSAQGGTFGNIRVGVTDGNTIDTSSEELTLDSTTGIIHIKAPQISLVNTLNIDSGTLFVDAQNDRVGIGTITPTATLHVAGTVDFNTASGTQGLYQDTSGRVGIGRINPSEKLDVEGNLSVRGASAVIYLGSLNAFQRSGNDMIFAGGPSSFENLRFYTMTGTATEKMRITSDGYVGVGTVTPNANLHVARSFSGDVAHFSSVGTDTSGLYISIDSSAAPTLETRYDHPSQHLILKTTNTSTDIKLTPGRNVLISSGNVGIGTASPQNKLEVNGAAVIGSTYVTAQRIAQTNGLLVEGAVGIGTFNPTGQLDIMGDVYIGVGTDYHMQGTTGLFVEGNLQVDGSTWLGNASADKLTVTGEFIHEGGDIIAEGGKFGNVRIGITDDNTIDTTVGKLTLSSTTGMIDINAVGIDLSSQATTINLIDTVNALNIEQDTFTIDAQNHRVGIGIAAPNGKMTILGTSASSPAALWINAGNPLLTAFGETTVGNSDFVLGMASNTAAARSVILGRKSRGTLAVPTVVADNDQLFSLLVSGYDGFAFQNPAAVDFLVDGTPSMGNVPARISFVTGTNSSNRAERLTIKSGGNVGIGTTSPQNKLDVNGNVIIGSTFVSGQKTAPVDGLAVLGNVGIGTITATNALQVEGGVAIGTLTYQVSAPSYGLLVEGAVGIGTTNPTGSLDVMGGSVYIGDGDVDHIGIGTTQGLYVAGRLEVDGSVWLGDASADTLRVTGIFTQNGPFTAENGTFGNIQVAVRDRNTIDTISGMLTIASESNTLKIETSLIDLSSQDTTISLGSAPNIRSLKIGAVSDNYSTLVVDAENGFVGIGSASPTQKLDVNGNVRATRYQLGDEAYIEYNAAAGGSIDFIIN